MKASAAALLLSLTALAPATGATAGENDLAASLRQQIIPCWTTMPGQFTPRDVVTMAIRLHLDGSLDGVPETVESNAGPALASSVRRAILKCEPFRLPSDQYDLWKEVKITFRYGN